MTLQRFLTNQALLFQMGSHDGSGLNFVIPFRFAAPGPRIMLTLALLVRNIGQPSVPFDWTSAGTIAWSIWVARTRRASDGKRMPTQNLVGTRANPVRLDTVDISVNGTSLDINTGGDGVDGEVTITATGSAGWLTFTQAVLQGRYNAIAPLCDEEWARARASFANSPEVPAATLVTS